jgi:hypothetical protein
MTVVGLLICRIQAKAPDTKQHEIALGLGCTAKHLSLAKHGRVRLSQTLFYRLGRKAGSDEQEIVTLYRSQVLRRDAT